MNQSQRSLTVREYTGVDYLEGPLMIIESAGDVGYTDIAYDELAEIIAPDGSVRLGRVLEVSQERAVVEIFGQSDDLYPAGLRVRFRGHSLRMAVAREMLGRIFDGLGRPRDGLPAPIAEARRDVNGAPLNPAARAYPRSYIETGISAIDGMNTLVRGQKLPIFSGNGLPHDALAAQIARQAHIGGENEAEENEAFAIIFAALGVSHDTAEQFQRSLTDSGALNRAALFLNLADDPPVERTITPRVALTLAEFLAFEHDRHVLVILTDMTNYGEALRELSNRREEVPTRKGFPGYLYSDLASLYERCGRVHGSSGSITLLPILTMPNDDITHPLPDLTGYITEGQIVLSRELDRQDIYPPIDVLSSLSRLMKDGVGEDQTRKDHANLSSQLYSAYTEAQDARALANIIGEGDLSDRGQAFLKFGERFEQQFLSQSQTESRSIVETLDLGWEVLSLLPKDELTRVSEDEIANHYPDHQAEAASESDSDNGAENG